jgi:hypothetical protein
VEYWTEGAKMMNQQQRRNQGRWMLGMMGILLAGMVCGCGMKPGTDGWVSLFNGKDLEGWQVKIKGYELNDNFGDTFRVEDGVMKVSYDQYEKFDNKFGHIFYKDSFSHYVFRVEYRFVGEQCPGGPGWAFRNSGVMVHGQSAESMGKDQSFPVSIEVQLLGGERQGQTDHGEFVYAGDARGAERETGYASLYFLQLPDVSRGSVGDGGSGSARRSRHQAYHQRGGGARI